MGKKTGLSNKSGHLGAGFMAIWRCDTGGFIRFKCQCEGQRCGGAVSARNKAHANTAYVLLAIGAVLLLVGLATSRWRLLAWSLAGLNLSIGAVMIAAVSIIEGVPWFARRLSRSDEPVWTGLLIHTDGGRLKVRYDFDTQNHPWFVARDICRAIGTKVPHENAMQCGGIPLLKHHDNECFSAASVQAYLAPLATRNRAANRLLISIRNEVLRKLDKQRDQEARAEKAS